MLWQMVAMPIHGESSISLEEFDTYLSLLWITSWQGTTFMELELVCGASWSPRIVRFLLLFHLSKVYYWKQNWENRRTKILHTLQNWMCGHQHKYINATFKQKELKPNYMYNNQNKNNESQVNSSW